ncbi:MAG: phage tail tube protein [Pseudomonadota bacterium]
MSEPIKARSKIVLAKIEATYGTDATPTGAADAMLTTEFQFTPMEGQDVARDLETPFLGADPSTPVDLHCTMTFNVELQGSGTAGTAPAWGPLLRACGCAEVITANTSVAYTPVSDGFEAVTVYFQHGGTLYRIMGARGTVKFDLSASGNPMLRFDFKGLYATPGEAARPTVDLSRFKPPLPVTDRNTPVFQIGGVDYVLRSFMLDLANQIEGRFLVGSEGILLVDRDETVELTIEATPMTTLNPYQLAETSTQIAVTLTHGTEAGKIITFAIPRAQMQRPQGLAEANKIVEWPLRLKPIPAAGDDQWTVTLT